MSGQNRLIRKNIDFASTGSSQTWTAPAGVTTITATLGDRTDSTIFTGSTYFLTVTPNTTYTFTINQTGYTSYENANTFGSLMSWAGANRIYLEWVE